MTQSEALDILKLGHNVFLTGAAGSGKTYLLNQYIKYLKDNRIPVGITASTGIAATHMGGTTIHSWSGMGIRDGMTEPEIRELFKRPYLRKRFLGTRVLIIDEISMLHSHQLDLVHLICKVVKNIDYPFGGMQVIMCGDFFQLPPVSRNSNIEARNPKQQLVILEGEHRPIESNIIRDPIAPLQDDNVRRGSTLSRADFVTESRIWRDMNLKICYLDEQHRQDDRAFLRVLNDIRNNEVNEDTFEHLQNRMKKDTEGYVKPTRLFTHNADVDKINAEHLEALTGEAHEYFMVARGNPTVSDILRKSCLAPTKLVLKIGAQVMFVKNNYEEGYVNGTLGEVIGFAGYNAAPGSPPEDSPIVRTFDGAEITVSKASWEVKEDTLEIAAIAQIPLRLAWAITVHKSQGMSLDAAEVDLSRSFVPGMGYVALSRVRSLAGLKLLGINQMALQVNEQVAEMDHTFKSQSDEAILSLHEMGIEKKTELQKNFLEFLKRV